MSIKTLEMTKKKGGLKEDVAIIMDIVCAIYVNLFGEEKLKELLSTRGTVADKEV